MNLNLYLITPTVHHETYRCTSIKPQVNNQVQDLYCRLIWKSFKNVDLSVMSASICPLQNRKFFSFFKTKFWVIIKRGKVDIALMFSQKTAFSFQLTDSEQFKSTFYYGIGNANGAWRWILCVDESAKLPKD